MQGIILTGLARAGKDTVADILERDFGFKKLVFSDCLIDEVKKRGLEVNKMNLSIAGDELRKKEGMGVVAKLVFEKAKKSKCEKAVFVGARSLEEVEFLKKNLEKSVLVRVVSEPHTRFGRKNEKDLQTKKEFFERDERDVKNKGLGKVIEIAEIEIGNNSDMKALGKDVKKLAKVFESLQ